MLRLFDWLTCVETIRLVDPYDEPDAGQPVSDEPEEDHQHGEDDGAVLGQPATITTR